MHLKLLSQSMNPVILISQVGVMVIKTICTWKGFRPKT